MPQHGTARSSPGMSMMRTRPREFFLASVVERLELRGGGEEFFDGYISCNRVVCRLFNRLQLFLSHRTVKVNCDDIVIHVETHVLVLEFRVHKAGKDVLSGVVLHVIEMRSQSIFPSTLVPASKGLSV